MKFRDLAIKFNLKFFKMAACSGVMLGIPDEIIPFEDDLSNGWTTNEFGGLPNWMNKAPDDYPQCSLCGRCLPMVAQIYCPLENSSYHRVLYIFGCTSVSCWNKNESWKVLRCQSLATNDEAKNRQQEQEEKQDNWCDDADNWGDEEILEEANVEVKQLEEQTANLKLNEIESPKQQSTSAAIERTTAADITTQVFIPHYITAIEESFILTEAAELTRAEKRLLDEYRAREGVRDIDEMLEGSSGGWGREKYEMSAAKHGDKIFQKFRKQLSLCPNQCLRYSWNGEPLLMTSQTLGIIPSCHACGQKRVFELQLMPALVSQLKTRVGIDNSQKDLSFEQYADYNNTSSECIEFGTVFVYTCSQECWSVDARYCEEYVIVHADPDQHLFKSVK